MTIEYGKEAYWDDRYAKESVPFDWLFSWTDISHLIKQLLPDHHAQILMVGCGNAPFSPEMYEEGGYHNIVNTDISTVVIAQQEELFPDQKWLVCDVTSMPEFPDGSFPVVIDKSLIDTLMCCKDSMNVTRSMIDELYRVLKPGGRLVTFSLHSLHEAVINYDPTYEGIRSPRASPLPLHDWRVSAFRVQSSRWSESREECKKAVAHTMIVCDKPLEDGTYPHSYPLHLDGVLSAEEHDALEARVRDLQFGYAVENVSYKSLATVLDRVLALSCPPSTHVLKQLQAADTTPLSESFVHDCEDAEKLWGENLSEKGHRIGDRPGGYRKKDLYNGMLTSVPPPPPARTTSAHRAYAREHVARASALKQERGAKFSTHAVVNN